VGSTSEARVSIPDMGKRFFSSPKISDLSWDPPSLIFNQRAPEALFLGIKRLGPEAGHSRSSSPEVNGWSSTFIAPYAFMMCTRRTLGLPFLCCVKAAVSSAVIIYRRICSFVNIQHDSPRKTSTNPEQHKHNENPCLKLSVNP
jgi:hypothetical protein